MNIESIVRTNPTRFVGGVGLVMFAFLFQGTHSVCGQDKAAGTQATTAEQVLDGYLSAIGGPENLKKYKTRRTTTAFSMPQQGLKAVMVITQAAPNKYRMEMELPGIGKILQVADGENVFDKNPLTGTRKLEGKEKEALLLESQFYADSQWRTIFSESKLEGIEDVDGRPNYKVSLTTDGGSKRTNFYDVETNLLTKTQAKLATPQGELSTENTFSDYKEVGGIKFPHKSVISLMGVDQLIEITKIENGVELPADTFEIPDA